MGTARRPLSFPFHVHARSAASITGGYVYRRESEGLHGQYFFADFVQIKFFRAAVQRHVWVAAERTWQIIPDAGTVNGPLRSARRPGKPLSGQRRRRNFPLLAGVIVGRPGETLSGLGGNDLLFGGRERSAGRRGGRRHVDRRRGRYRLLPVGLRRRPELRFRAGNGSADKVMLTAVREYQCVGRHLRELGGQCRHGIDFGARSGRARNASGRQPERG